MGFTHRLLKSFSDLHFLSSVLGLAHSLSLRVTQAPCYCASVLPGHPMVGTDISKLLGSLPQLGGTFTSRHPRALFRDSNSTTGFLAATFHHYAINPGTSAAIDAGTSSLASPDLSQHKVSCALYDPFMSSKLAQTPKIPQQYSVTLPAQGLAFNLAVVQLVSANPGTLLRFCVSGACIFRISFCLSLDFYCCNKKHLQL